MYCLIINLILITLYSYPNTFCIQSVTSGAHEILKNLLPRKPTKRENMATATTTGGNQSKAFRCTAGTHTNNAVSCTTIVNEDAIDHHYGLCTKHASDKAITDLIHLSAESYAGIIRHATSPRAARAKARANAKREAEEKEVHFDSPISTMFGAGSSNSNNTDNTSSIIETPDMDVEGTDDETSDRSSLQEMTYSQSVDKETARRDNLAKVEKISADRLTEMRDLQHELRIKQQQMDAMKADIDKANKAEAEAKKAKDEAEQESRDLNHRLTAIAERQKRTDAAIDGAIKKPRNRHEKAHPNVLYPHSGGTWRGAWVMFTKGSSVLIRDAIDQSAEPLEVDKEDLLAYDVVVLGQPCPMRRGTKRTVRAMMASTSTTTATPTKLNATQQMKHAGDFKHKMPKTAEQTKVMDWANAVHTFELECRKKEIEDKYVMEKLLSGSLNPTQKLMYLQWTENHVSRTQGFKAYSALGLIAFVYNQMRFHLAEHDVSRMLRSITIRKNEQPTFFIQRVKAYKAQLTRLLHVANLVTKINNSGRRLCANPTDKEWIATAIDALTHRNNNPMHANNSKLNEEVAKEFQLKVNDHGMPMTMDQLSGAARQIQNMVLCTQSIT